MPDAAVVVVLVDQAVAEVVSVDQVVAEVASVGEDAVPVAVGEAVQLVLVGDSGSADILGCRRVYLLAEMVVPQTFEVVPEVVLGQVLHLDSYALVVVPHLHH